MEVSQEVLDPPGPGNPPDNYRWFHLTLTTDGTWLHSDERSFRTRHHRELCFAPLTLHTYHSVLMSRSCTSWDSDGQSTNTTANSTF
jgi:hypothetical protein